MYRFRAISLVMHACHIQIIQIIRIDSHKIHWANGQFHPDKLSDCGCVLLWNDDFTQSIDWWIHWPSPRWLSLHKCREKFYAFSVHFIFVTKSNAQWDKQKYRNRFNLLPLLRKIHPEIEHHECLTQLPSCASGREGGKGLEIEPISSLKRNL